MAQYFKNVQSFEDLKNQFKALARKNHPDAGGDPEAMKAINCEYDKLFPIWKDRYNTTATTPTEETANSFRNEFYTQNGWKGEHYNSNQSLKEIATIVRAYVKEKYPTYKFSVRTSYASMCQELHVALKEAPMDIYKKSPDELTEEEKRDVHRSLRLNHIFEQNSWHDHELTEAIKLAWEKNDYYKVYTEQVAEMLEDVDDFVESYNFRDCDGQIDYFHVKFYYFNCKPKDLKIVPKTARIKNRSTSPAKKSNEKPEPNFEAIETKSHTYKITKGEDSRDGSELWLVRICEKLERDAYIAENKAMQNLGGYYSKFRKAFIFRFDPTDILNGGKAT